MAKLEYFHTFFDSSDFKRLKDNNIRSVTDFLQETPENICKITKLHYKDVLEVRQKLLQSYQGKSVSAYDLLNETTRNCFTLTTGINELDSVMDGFKSGNTYEVCGLSGSGKTQICLALVANTVMKDKCVYYVDTKGDFSATRVEQYISKRNPSKKTIIACLERIRITKSYSLHQLICTLHWLKHQLMYDCVPLIIIDCISTAYFLSVGSNKPIGLGLINHIASLVKYIALEHHSIVVITNLATKQFKHSDDVLRKVTKPCLGKYWLHVANYRLNMKKENNITEVSIEGDSLSTGTKICSFDVKDL